MLGLPSSTEVNRRVAKEKLYTNANLTPRLRDMIKDQIESITWRNKLSEDTIGIGAGKDITEIQVFEVQLRQRELDKRVISAIAKAIPYKILFVLVYEHETQACIEASDVLYNTEWLPQSGLVIKFEGLNLDAVYENLARQIAGGRLGTSEDSVDIEKAVDRDKKRQQLEREIANLEKKILREKQFNKQVEMNNTLKVLRAEMERLE